jgi:hypothetical protein
VDVEGHLDLRDRVLGGHSGERVLLGRLLS